ncbi:MAG: folP [Ignavibacteria bacterium]|nr:folP [Ignavibacteria bacterium]
MIKFPKIMGVVNVTPDSFSDGGLFLSRENAVNQALRLIDEGADIIDIGGESTRPGSARVTIEDEITRVIPVINEIKKINPAFPISIDTMNYDVALEALNAGASFINDVSAFREDIRIVKLAAEHKAALIIMHMQGNPETMQLQPEYINVVNEVYNFLETKVAEAKIIGAESIFIDVGIGFGKTLEQNLELLRNLGHFKKLGTPMVLGISRKSFFGKLLGIENPLERDIATALLHSLLFNVEVEIIRVHNVTLLSQLKKLYESICLI